LVMPGLHSANISASLLNELGDGAMLGPVLTGFEKPVQIVEMHSSVSDIINLAAVAALEPLEAEEGSGGSATPKSKKAA